MDEFMNMLKIEGSKSQPKPSNKRRVIINPISRGQNNKYYLSPQTKRMEDLPLIDRMRMVHLLKIHH